jgi:subtilase family serine protease
LLTRAHSVGLAPVAAGLALALATPAAVSAAERLPLRDSVPAYVLQSRGVPVPGGRTLHFQVVLGLKDGAGARALAGRVSDPRSDSYRQFVPASEFRRRFGWTRREVGPVARWLRRRGMTVGRPAPNGALLPASGTATQFERAFGARLASYRSLGQELIAPRAPLTVPRSIAPKVQGTIGIPEIPATTSLAGAADADSPVILAGSGGPSADPGPPLLGSLGGVVARQPPAPYCSRYWGAQFGGGLPEAYGQRPLLAICGYDAKQIRSAYGAQRLYRRGIDGSGVDIGIVTGYTSPTLRSDLSSYSRDNRIPKTRLRIKRPTEYSPANRNTVWGFYTEQTLDTQVSHGMAPGARIHYSGPDGANRQIPALARMVDRNRVDVISNSWATPEVLLSGGYFRAGEDILVQAAAQGITMLFGAGDTGDNIKELRIRSVDYPASSRWATAVGGTTLNVGPTNERVWEQGWGESGTSLDGTGEAWDPAPPGNYRNGSTGGTSRVFRQPGYQRARVPSVYSGYFGGRARVVPDVGLIADPMSGPGLVQTAIDPTTGDRLVTRHSVGGTSVATPVLAGAVAMMADRNGGRLGFLNPALYRVGSKAVRRVGPPGTPAVSAQVSYANFVDESDGFDVELLSGGDYGTLTVRKGYDDVTGLGSPSVSDLAERLRRLRRSG